MAEPGNPTKSTTSISENNMDTPTHQNLYETGLEIRKKVVGEDYVANALENGKSDFLRPLQQFATVCYVSSFFWSLHVSDHHALPVC